VDGRFNASPVAWTDSGEGRYVYFGDTAPLATPQLDAVLDRALPDAIRGQLLRQLPGQVTVHFHGEQWPQEMTRPGFADDRAWHLAHEAAHVYQRQLAAEEDGGAWIHEGGADAFAALAMRTVAPEAAAHVEARVAAAPDACRRIIGTRSVRAAISARDFDASHACGLVIALAIDRGVRRVRPDLDGLYSVWRDYMERAGAASANVDRAALFIDSVARAGGADPAAWVRRASSDPQPVLDLPDSWPAPAAAQGDAAPAASEVGAPGPTGQPSNIHATSRIDQPTRKVTEYGSITDTSVPMPALAR
jgi:hypothetical protein